jgi:hypothetical protein
MADVELQMMKEKKKDVNDLLWRML